MYDPLVGLTTDGSIGFGRGVLTGTTSLVRNTVAGVGLSASKLSASAARGLSMAVPSNTRTLGPGGVPADALLPPESWAEGIKEGGTGLYLEPLLGFQRGGLPGMLRGLFTGLLGVGVRPLAGLLGTAAMTSAVLGRFGSSADGWTQTRMIRVRPPRIFNLSSRVMKVCAALIIVSSSELT